MIKHRDGSVTIAMPQIHSGPETYPVVSGFLAGVCRLLDYNSFLQHSEEWSATIVDGVSLGFDGQIYVNESGTYLTSLRCKNVARAKFNSPGRQQFEKKLKESRE